MSVLELDARLTWYPEGKQREIKAKARQREREAALMFQRTLRRVVGVKGRSVPISGGRVIFLDTSPPGGPPLKQTGQLQRFVRTDRTPGMEGQIVSTEAYGLERDVIRPHLRPVFEANKAIIALVLTGKTSAPRFGDTGLMPKPIPKEGRGSVRVRPGRGRKYDAAKRLRVRVNARPRIR